MSYAQAAASAASAQSRSPALQFARHSETIIYDNIPAELSAESIANSFSEFFKIPVQFYVRPDSNRNVVMELQSADDVRTVLATPLAVESLNLSLTAHRLATTAGWPVCKSSTFGTSHFFSLLRSLWLLSALPSPPSGKSSNYSVILILATL
ncbi:hypothetical protein V1514DRAFT_344187 [Lipomyces japonicus]|uniref:uncharacterized protein n=1 Tax=Lipomyces japonicus TaxID=56871 RepID=UPI0034CDC5A0